MYIYHPVFKFIENAIIKKKYGKLKYLISSFRFPSLEKKIIDIKMMRVEVFL